MNVVRTIAVGFLLAGLGLLALGAGIAHWQAALLRRAVPVQAKILATRVEVNSSQKGTMYRPVVVFAYEAGGRSWQADKVSIFSVSSSNRAWAEGTVGQFAPGQRVTAYCDPANPGRAFLMYQCDFFPYVLIFMALPFGSVAIATLVASRGTPSAPAPAVARAEGWYELLPAVSLVAKRRAIWIAFAWWDTVGLAALVHYAWIAAPRFETAAWIAGGGYLVGSLALASAAVYFTLRARAFGEARIFLDRSRMVRGEPATVALRQKVYETLFVEEAELSLLGQETRQVRQGGKVSVVTDTVWEQVAVLFRNRNLSAGQAVEAAAEFTIPTDQMPSSPRAARGYPRYEWMFRLALKVPGRPDYRASFPLLVT